MKPAWDQLGKKFSDSPVFTIADVDCTNPAGEKVCGKMGVKGYPTIKYYTKKTGRGGADYQGGRDFNAMKSFTESTFKASCDPFTQKGCNDMEKRFIDKNKDASKDVIGATLKEKLEELKNMKKEKSDVEKEHKEKMKTFKKKETALNKAVDILKKLEKKAKPGKSEEL